MKFTTPVELNPYSFNIEHKHNILCIGSCFASHISKFLEQLHFRVHSNPRGILYNPISICETIQDLLSPEEFNIKDLQFRDDLWHSFDHHGDYSHPNQKQSLENIQFAKTQASAFLQKTDYIIITLGTAHVFKLKENSKVVANCHKFPQELFTRELLHRKTIVTECNKMIEAVAEIRPDVKWIFTVSPVRHKRDGMIQNQQSKASLILSIEQIIKQNENAYYFPAYEIMMDELRNYRFYKEDMIHPSQQAIDFILAKFASMVFTEKTKTLNQQIEKINRGLAHRPIHKDSKDYQAFKKDLKEQMEKIEKQTQGLIRF